MTTATEQTSHEAPTDTSLLDAVRRVLAASPEPLTLSKIRARLPGNLRQVGLNDLAEGLRRQVAANTLFQYPRYRSAQDRFWDRPMPVHVAALLRAALQDGPLPWPRVRRRLPSYALAPAESVLSEQLAQGLLHRHPPAAGRGGPRFGLTPPDPKEHLRRELPAVFRKLEALGFSQAQLRAAAVELLQDEEWGRPAAAVPEAAAEPARSPDVGADAAGTASPQENAGVAVSPGGAGGP